MDLTFAEAVDRVGQFTDAAGVLVIVVGILFASGLYLVRWNRKPSEVQYRRYRQTIGRAILLGLELLLAADIIRTVAIEPTFRSLGVLAVIVAIRTFLSLELELEIDGRFPWQRDTTGTPDDVRRGASGSDPVRDGTSRSPEEAQGT